MADKPVSCVEQFIADHQLEPYNGNGLDLGCKFYTDLFELDGQQYFRTNCNCADMITVPVDCSGTAYCVNIDAPELSYFYRNAAFIGIIGVEP
ncbi:MAG: hypothetical protein ABIQ93_02880 [Saprospiraceae bacterium]